MCVKNNICYFINPFGGILVDRPPPKPRHQGFGVWCTGTLRHVARSWGKTGSEPPIVEHRVTP